MTRKTKVKWALVGLGICIVAFGLLLCSYSQAKVAREQTPDKLERAVLAIRGHFKHVRKHHKKLVAAAREAAGKAKAPWITPELLLALGIQESDLRWWLKVGLDCGIAQNRVNEFCRKRKCYKKLCSRLSKSAKLSMEYAVIELEKIGRRYCRRRDVYGRRLRKGSWQWRRCVYNVYNQGPYYNRNNRYWLRLSCFHRAMVEGRAPTRMKRGKPVLIPCRWAKSLRWINWAFRK